MGGELCLPPFLSAHLSVLVSATEEEDRADFLADSWWIKPAAAFRDGMIHSFEGITADEVAAYALVLTLDAEKEAQPEKNLPMRFEAAKGDPGCKSLMKNMLSKDPVRVLRTYKQTSGLRPEVGIRYDGL